MGVWPGLVLGVGLAAASPALGQQWAGDAVTQSLADRAGNPQNGRAIVVSRQTGLCLLCHSGPFPGEKFQGTLAPNLQMSVVNLSEGQIRARLIDAARTNPGTIMPSYYRTDHLSLVAKSFDQKTLLTAQELEDVVAFLMTLK